MSRPSILALTAIAALGSTSLIPADAATRFRPAASRSVAARHAPAAAARPAFVRPVNPHIAASASHAAFPPGHPHTVQVHGAGLPNANVPAVHSNATLTANSPPGHSGGPQNLNNVLTSQPHVFGNGTPGLGAGSNAGFNHALAGSALSNVSQTPAGGVHNSVLTNQPHILAAGAPNLNTQNGPGISHSFSNSSAGNILQSHSLTPGNGEAGKNGASGGTGTPNAFPRPLGSPQQPSTSNANLTTFLTNRENAAKATAQSDFAAAQNDRAKANADLAKAQIARNAAAESRQTSNNPHNAQFELAQAQKDDARASFLENEARRLNAAAGLKEVDGAVQSHNAKEFAAAANTLAGGASGKGAGPTGTGPTGTGPTGAGPTGIGPTGAGPTGIGPIGQQPNGRRPGNSGGIVTPNTSADTVTTLTLQARAERGEARNDIATAKADRSQATADLNQAQTLRNAAVQADAQGQARAAARDRAFADVLDGRAKQLNSEATSLRQDATKLRKEANADSIAANRLAAGNQPKGDRQTPGQQPSGQQPDGQQPASPQPTTQQPTQTSTDGFSGGQQAPSVADSGQAQLTGMVPPSFAQAAASPAASPIAPFTAQNQPSVRPASALMAVALSWNTAGGWSVQKDQSLDVAGNIALAQCNSQFGNCSLSTAAIAPTVSGCLAVARANEDASRLFAGVGDTLDTARASLVQQIRNEGVTGQLIFSDCNAEDR